VAADGRPWFAMEYVEGRPITEYARSRRLDLRARVELLLRVARAVAFAQSRLVVHRDLKPGNILIDAEGRPRLLDFGIAKLIEGSEQAEATQTAARALSPAYAAPEQLLDAPIGTATDVFALGLLLFELLTGRLPHGDEGSGAQALMQRATQEITLRASQLLRSDTQTARAIGIDAAALPRLARSVAGDLDLILLTALRREPERRYASAAAFADELERWLKGQPIAARPDSAGYRLRRFVARHRLGVAASAAAVLVLLGALGAALWQAERATEAEARALAEADKARAAAERANRSLAFFAELFTSASPVLQGRDLSVAELVRQAADRIETQLAGYPIEQVELSKSVAQHLIDHGEVERAYELANRAVTRAREMPGATATWLATALESRAHAGRQIGRNSQAEADLREALALWPGEGPEDRRSRIRLRTHLGSVLINQGRLEDALEVNQGTLAERVVLLGSDEDHALAVDWNNLGSVLLQLERYAEAEQAYRRAIALYALDVQAPPSRRVWLLTGLALARVWSAPDAQAEALMAEARQTALAALPPGHAVLASLAMGEAQLLALAGRAEEAERVLLDSLAQQESSSVPTVAGLVLQRAELRFMQGREGEALVLLEEGLALLMERTEGRGPLALRYRSLRALVQARTGSVEDALAESGSVLQALREAPSRYPRSLAEAKLNHAELLWRSGREAEALALRAQAESVLAALWPNGHPRARHMLQVRLPGAG
jgi:eukaryotic-like serine/threonine-protein kinase